MCAALLSHTGALNTVDFVFALDACDQCSSSMQHKKDASLKY